MKKSFLAGGLLAATLLCSASTAQIQWEKFYGGDKYEFSSKLIELSDKNLLACSYTESYGAGDCDMWIVKLTPSGDTIWTKTYGGAKYECATAIHELSDGTILVAGSTGSIVADTLQCAWDVWLLKLKSNGDSLWSNTFFGSRSAGVDMVVDAQENIYLAANSSKNDPDEDVQIIKCNKDGTAEWVKYYGGSDRETLNAFNMTSDGSLLLLMTTQSFSPKTMWLFKLTSDGEKVWDRTYGGTFRYGNASDIIEISDGTYMLAGYNGENTTTLFVLNMDKDGTIAWQKNYPKYTSVYSPTFTRLSSGNFFISSVESSINSFGRQVRLIRMDDTGSVIWDDLIGDTGVFTSASSFLETSDGTFLMLGGTNRLTKTSDDMWLVSLTPDMYVNMGGTLKYHLVSGADSSSYTYTLLTAPEQMTVSSGGSIQWAPKSEAAFSELVSVVLKSATSSDTVSFVVHVNKNGTATLPEIYSPVVKFTSSKSPKVIISNGSARICAQVNGFNADIFTIQGIKVTSLSSHGSTSAVWNLRDNRGCKVQPGRYIIRVAASGYNAKCIASVIR